MNLWLDLYLDLYKYKPIKEIYVKSINDKVLVVHSKDEYLAKYVPFINQIIIGEDLFSIQDKHRLNYILVHEYGHKKMNRIIFFILLSIGIFNMIIGVMGLISSVVYFLLSFVKTELLMYYTFLIMFVSLFFLVIGILASWCLELYADLYAVRKIGMKEYFYLLDQRRKNPIIYKKKDFNYFVNYILHPPEKVTELIIRIFHKYIYTSEDIIVK